MTRTAVGAWGLFCWMASACADAGGGRMEIPLQVAGTTPAIANYAGWEVQLTRADLAFGPLYLCAGEQAGELCDVASAEWLDSVVVNVLGTKPKAAGRLSGTTGEVRSFMYDLGISSVFTQQQPLVLSAAESLEGHSVVVEGAASQGEATFRFILPVVIAQGAETEVNVPVVRKSLSESFEHTLVEGEQLRLKFDASEWLRDVDFQAIYVEYCVSACDEPILLPADSQAARALRNALLVRNRPVFEWR
jgi:hypothetical protein